MNWKKTLICILTIVSVSLIMAAAVFADDLSDAADGLVRAEDGSWYYVEGGEIQYGFTGIRQNEFGWWYVRDGKIDFSADTLAQNEYGWWKITEGKVDFDFNGVASNETGDWYIENGRVDFSVNGIVFIDNDQYAGWRYFRNGCIAYEDTVAPNEYGWWKVTGGTVDFGYNGIASNPYGDWYIEYGKVDFTENGLEYLDNKGDEGWWNLVGGRVSYDNALVQNEYGWWFANGGKVDFGYYGIVPNEYGWWKVSGGRIDFDYTGIAQNEYGWWYLENGKVDFRANTVAGNEYGWWKITDGMVDFSFSGIASNSGGYWYIKNGMVDFGFNEIAADDDGSWYFENGRLENGYTGTAAVNGITYNVENGMVTSVASGASLPAVFGPLVKDKTIHYGSSLDICEITCVHACYCDTHSWTNPSTGHLGIDLVAPDSGMEVLAAASGTVVYVHHQYYENSGSYGSHPGEAVAVYVGNGLIYEYHELHSNSVTVNVGDWVNAGDVIGTVGLTGVTTGCHIHFSVLYWLGAEYTDDLSAMPQYEGPSTDGFIQLNPLFFFGQELTKDTETWYAKNKYEWYGYKNTIPGDPRNYPALASRLYG